MTTKNIFSDYIALGSKEIRDSFNKIDSGDLSRALTGIPHNQRNRIISELREHVGEFCADLVIDHINHNEYSIEEIRQAQLKIVQIIFEQAKDTNRPKPEIGSKRAPIPDRGL